MNEAIRKLVAIFINENHDVQMYRKLLNEFAFYCLHKQVVTRWVVSDVEFQFTFYDPSSITVQKKL